MEGSLIRGISDQVATQGAIISLIFLTFRIRGQSIPQRAAIVESLRKSVADINAPLPGEPGIGILISRSPNRWGMASLEDQRRAYCFLFFYFKLTEPTWFQMKSGALNAER